MSRYSIEAGRIIRDDLTGTPLVYIGHCEQTKGRRYNLAPVYADTFARELVRALNGEADALENMRAALREERY